MPLFEAVENKVAGGNGNEGEARVSGMACFVFVVRVRWDLRLCQYLFNPYFETPQK